MKQMTIRSMDPDLEDAIEKMSRERQWSINQVATHLMRKGLGLTADAAPHPIGSQLDAFWGVWGKEESQAFDDAVVETFGRVDEELWK